MEYTIANSEMANEKEAQLYTCQSCGKKYIVRKCEAQHFAKGSDRHYCVPCRKAFRAKLEREREEQEDLIWQRKKAEDQKLFESLQTATFCGQQGRISRTVRAILNGQPGILAGRRVLRPTDQY